MGLQSDIGYEVPRTNALQRAAIRFGGTRLGTIVFSRVLRTLDLTFHRLSGGRRTFGGVFGGVPIVMLTTTGARSGRARTNPLIGIPHGVDVAVSAANYGLGVIPSWVYNLRASRDAELSYGRRTAKVRAREVSGEEADEVFAAAILIYPGYVEYRKRFDQPIPVFVLAARHRP